MHKHSIIILLCLAVSLCARAQQQDSTATTLDEITISSHSSGISRLGGAVNGVEIGNDELFRAACCNLGESFVTNPSVDVNYSDAATGTKQIKLLGLSGLYVQMMVENLPYAEGCIQPYSLGFVPGAWLSSIQVSKGASSVKNGFSSITGQINIEYLKPDDEPAINGNFYIDSRLKGELNLSANTRFSKHLSTILLAHYEQEFMKHDENGDNWIDAPAVRQFNIANRWKYQHGRFVTHAGFGYVFDRREGGQTNNVSNPFAVEIYTNLFNAYLKQAVILNREHNTNIALTANATLADHYSGFGHKQYWDLQQSVNAQLMLEHEFNSEHSISTGLSMQGIHLDESTDSINITLPQCSESTIGAYAQYTFKPNYHITAMAGVRVDRSSLFNTFVTPRLHFKWVVNDNITLRMSAGKGYRTPYILAENSYILASGRTIDIQDIAQEEAWNGGINMSWLIPMDERTLKLGLEYYHTAFLNQTIIDYDSDPSKIIIEALDCRGDKQSFSNTVQLDATCNITDEIDLTAAFRVNDVHTTLDGKLQSKPLTSLYKGLLSAAWKPYMGIWSLDLTLQLNGGGRMPKPYTLANGEPSWDERFPAYAQLNLQVSRRFKHLTAYIGGENLTNYKQPVPVVGAENPWSNEFEPTLIWGPVHGIMIYGGVRMNF